MGHLDRAKITDEIQRQVSRYNNLAQVMGKIYRFAYSDSTGPSLFITEELNEVFKEGLEKMWECLLSIDRDYFLEGLSEIPSDLYEIAKCFLHNEDWKRETAFIVEDYLVNLPVE